MPSYLDFNSTKKLREDVLKKNLKVQNGPLSQTNSNYQVRGLNNYSVIDQANVEVERGKQLTETNKVNIYKPTEYFIQEKLNVFSRRANLRLYYSSGSPYFLPRKHNLFSIVNGEDYSRESELFKFASNYIKTAENGPFKARIRQNLEANTLGKVRLLDALNGNTATAVNLLTGKEPLIEKNYKITVAKTVPGKVVDFLQTVAGVEFPFTEIPGNYLSNPINPVNFRPEAQTVIGRGIQDVTGVLGSLVGIQRRPTRSFKPSDIFIDFMGEGQRQILFDHLLFSRYAPNYTTSARSQQSTKLFSFVDRVGGLGKTLLGLEAPRGQAYIGDDRGNDVRYATSDFNDRIVRSNYYTSYLFDPIQAELFKKDKNIGEGGPIAGRLTWISKKSNNKLGEHNKEFSAEKSLLEDTLSKNLNFREDSILAETQRILDSMPSDGGAARSHVANVIDQTSRVFREGDVMLSKGSAVKYVDKFTGEETGVEFGRVWTKDRPYMNYSDTMKRTTNIRKFDSSVMTTPWNLNYAPMSNGKKGFDGSSNIARKGDGFYAKKYMFSLENLAWKLSNRQGFRVSDLPFCERGPNDGRIMWFPPYDLKVTENNSARWESNTFLGRPEPIYTYQNTERSGQISFKVVVDHPSILNLLVREHFKNMSDEEADNYINAFFAGVEELDFYNLIRLYTTLDADDVKNIKAYLDSNKDPETIKKYRVVTDDIKLPVPNTSPDPNSGKPKKLSVSLNFPNDYPLGNTELTSTQKYNDIYNYYNGNSSKQISDFNTAADTLLKKSSNNNKNVKNDKLVIFGKEDIPSSETGTTLTTQTTELTNSFSKLQTNFTEYSNKITELKNDISGKTIQEIKITLYSTSSSIADEKYNLNLSVRRSNSVVQDIFDKISNGKTPDIKSKWIKSVVGLETSGAKFSNEFTFKEFGYDNDGKIIIESQNFGEKFKGTINGQQNVDCNGKEVYTDKILKRTAPITFYCRQTTVKFEYTPKVIQPTESNKNNVPPIEVPKTRLEPIPDSDKPGQRTKKPPIDVLKRIIMKTLSECYYFKKLEEDSPVSFKSLKEKLRYFHPGFHSTTPEGLNSRLTFLQQCIRPGDTIPIKGISDISDLPARNTTFGPPPICVLRIGDFYHSKIVIRDVNISYDENVWDLNPEGIGVQPMIASVQLQVNFIGGQGIEKPVERLQNALSSNFYANTEMYDERSISTNTLIGGESTSGFTKSFLEDLQKINDVSPSAINDAGNSENTINGKYIGDFNQSTSGFTYTNIVKDLFKNTDDYFKKYPSSFNIIYKKYGPIITSVVFSENYRSIKNLEVNTNGVGGTRTISLMGLYREPKSLSSLIEKFLPVISTEIENQDITTMLNFDNVLKNSEIINKSNTLLKPFIKDYIKTELNNLVVSKEIKDLEDVRNKLISSVDKLNYIVKNGYDSKLDKKENTKANLSGFTSNLLYDEYDHCLDYIEKNQPKLNDYDDNSIDFNSPTISLSTLKHILQVLLKEQKQNILKLYEVDKTLFTTSDLEKMGNKFDKFIETIKEKKFKNSNFKNRKNDKEISFGVSTFQPLTDSTATTEISKIMKKNKVPAENNKLNFYKP